MPILTPEEQEAMLQRLWEKSLPEIEKSLLYALQQELRHMAATEMKRRMGKELQPLIEKVVADNRERIMAAITRLSERIVAHAETEFETAMRYEVQHALSGGVEEPMKMLGVKLSNTMYRIVDKILDEERKTREEARLAARTPA